MPQVQAPLRFLVSLPLLIVVALVVFLTTPFLVLGFLPTPLLVLFIGAPLVLAPSLVVLVVLPLPPLVVLVVLPTPLFFLFAPLVLAPSLVGLPQSLLVLLERLATALLVSFIGVSLLFASLLVAAFPFSSMVARLGSLFLPPEQFRL